MKSPQRIRYEKGQAIQQRISRRLKEIQQNGFYEGQQPRLMDESLCPQKTTRK